MNFIYGEYNRLSLSKWTMGDTSLSTGCICGNNAVEGQKNGRQVIGVSQNETTTAPYSYNADGLRTSKIVNGVITEYYWMNGTLHGQKTGEEYIYFLYDESGVAYGFIVKNGTEEAYYYYDAETGFYYLSSRYNNENKENLFQICNRIVDFLVFT